ncbi:aminopeptidase [Basidiobolus meristosporus CBS 931.73]|uniref:Peptide hydrolase n=1 Tax=Basidiobolus meristosporus CBS 931.73 TaxID=1314790 RepID=A0A1Y1YHG1_9FUNG|nr:aminopeptidase [Basidiobolus meristosporus CBS 931.73]ORX97409.1 aminopeptidase [Basidiobolus meristosporus CBS 931.73]|eukprot:ORX63667.1 aminopeptidase [Basidiobolus meristosporus CBS 931.73]
MKASIAILTLAATAAAALQYEGLRSEWLQHRITLKGLLRHTDNLQKFATQHNGTRVFGSEGHQLTLDYIRSIVERSGYEVTLQEFSAPYSETKTEKLSANGKEYEIGAMTLTASTPESGLTAPVVLVQGVTGDGCTAEEFSGVELKGKIALIERGGCAFNDKSVNASKYGAVATIIYNNSPGSLKGTLGAEGTSTIPTGGISQESGKELIELLKKGEVVATLNLVELRENRKTYNIIAETKGGDPKNVIMLGAHTDSVRAGPGINDNGSGSSALLEIAYQFRHIRPKNKVRFGWWSSEEFGLLGSEHYVKSLTHTDVDNIAVILNFDMLASPNYIIRTYNGDSSGEPVPAGSEVITKLFEDHFKAKDIVYESSVVPYSRTDVGPFAEVGIPSGGLDTGADEIKTEEQAEKFGGKAGEALDQCYHLACDTTANLAHGAFLINARSIAHAVAVYSHDVSSVSKARASQGASTASKRSYGRRVPLI